MSKIIAKPFEVTNSTSGIALGKGEKKGQSYIRLSLTGAAQEAYFGGAFTDNDAISLEIDDQPGRNHMLRIALADPQDANALTFRRGIKGSIYVQVMPWCQIADGKRPTKAMQVVTNEGRNVCFAKLPDWARPPVRKAKGMGS